MIIDKILTALRWTYRSVLTLATLALALLLLLAAWSDRIDPQRWAVPQLLGIGFGVLMAVAVAWTLVLAIQRRWHCVAVMAVTMAVLYNPMSRMFPLHLWTTPAHHAKAAPGDTLHLLTYNTCSLGMAHVERNGERLDVIEYLRQSGADVICLQEYCFAPGTSGYTRDKMRRQLSDLYPYYDYRPNAQREVLGVATFSRYPLHHVQSIDTQQRDYLSAQYYQMELPSGRHVGLINAHMQSNQLRMEARQLYDDMLEHFERDSLNSIRNSLIDALLLAWRRRAAQAHQMAGFLADNHPADMPLIICGDLNDTPISHTLHTLRHAPHAYGQPTLADSWQEAGFGPGITYHEHRFWFRIDHILHSPQLHTLSIRVRRDIAYSDHYPVEATLVVEN